MPESRYIQYVTNQRKNILSGKRLQTLTLRQISILTQFFNDSLRQIPWFKAAAVLIIALGIAALVTGLVSVLHLWLLQEELLSVSA